MTRLPGYLQDLEGDWTAADGTQLVVRPIRPEDAAREQDFVRALSPQSRRQRFMYAIRELSPEQLARFTRLDDPRELALVALERQPDGAEVQVAVARFATDVDVDSERCEFAIAVADAWQRRGLGRCLMTRLIAAARQRGLRYMSGQIRADNQGMLALARSLGFSVEPLAGEPGVQQATLRLTPP